MKTSIFKKILLPLVEAAMDNGRCFSLLKIFFLKIIAENLDVSIGIDTFAAK